MLSKLWQKILSARKPLMLLHWRFFLPGQSKQIRLHRMLALRTLMEKPCVLSMLLALISALRWYAWNAWVISWRFSRKIQSDDMPSFAQYLRFALGYCIEPRFVRQYRLHQHSKFVFRFLYDSELPQAHEILNSDRSAMKQSQQLLSDKYAFAQTLAKQGFPIVETELLTDISQCFRESSVFIKPRCAARCMDAMHLFYNAPDYCLMPINGKAVDQVEQHLNKLINKQAMILQPCLDDHPFIASMTASPAVTTFRIITHKQETVMPMYIQIEMPQAEKAENDRQYYHVYPLDFEDLNIHPIFRKHCQHEIHCQDFPDDLKVSIQQAIEFCMQAHQQCFDLATVSFDVVITPDGPVILEANSNWAVSVLFNVVDFQDATSLDSPVGRYLEQVFE